MSTHQKHLLDTIALSSIVIALASLGTMAKALLDIFAGDTLLPLWVIHTILRLCLWAALGFAVYAIVHYFRK